MKRGEKWFLEKLRKNFDFENYRSDSRLILDTYLLYRELPLPSSCCKGEACLPRSHYQGKPRVQNCVSANNEQGSMKRGEKWFSEKLQKSLT